MHAYFVPVPSRRYLFLKYKYTKVLHNAFNNICNSFVATRCCCSNQDETGTKKKIFTCVQGRTDNSDNKISIIGAGRVGTALAYSLLLKEITNEICLIDSNKAIVKGHLMDLRHASVPLRDTKIMGSSDYEHTANSKIVVISVGQPGLPKKHRLELLEGSVCIMKKIIPQIMKYTKEPILYIITNPCDVAAYVAWKLSGLPKPKVIGSGTQIDSNRLRGHIARRLNIGASNVRGWMLGEHGETMVPLWSTVTIGGIRLLDLNPKAGQPDDPEKWADVYQQVRTSGIKMVYMKGSTEWAMSTAACDILRSILINSTEVYAASTGVKGLFGIEEDIFMSLPVVVGRNGVTDIIKPTFTESELKAFQKSAENIVAAQKSVQL